MTAPRLRLEMPSALSLGWIALIGGCGLAYLALSALPAPRTDNDVRIVLPSEPDRYASGPGKVEAPIRIVSENGEMADLNSVLPSDEAAAIAGLAEDDPDETTGGGVTDEDRPFPVTEDMLPTGAVRIVLPDTVGSADIVSEVPRRALTALTGEGRFGTFPQVSADGRRPFDTYRHRTILADGPKVGVVVAGLGLDRTLSRQAISALPASVSLAFSPYGRDVHELIELAMADGHEVLLELPMEAPGVSDRQLGTAALKVGQTPSGNRERLEWILARAPAYPMVTSYLGQTFVGDPAAMQPVVETLAERGIGFLDDTGLARISARNDELPVGETALVIPPGTSDVRGALNRFARRADAESGPLVKIYATASSLPAVTKWTAGLEAQGVTIVPASSSVGVRP